MAPVSFSSLNIREEYANAFRTESYTEFWSRVLDLTLAHGAGLKPNYKPDNPSYCVFVEGLLDPDQDTATRILSHSRTRPVTRTLLVEFYSQTANASLLCGLLLRDIDRIRNRYRPLRSAVRSDNPETVRRLLANFDFHPFNLLTTSEFKRIQSGSIGLLDRLDLNRRKVRGRLQFAARVRTGITVFLVALAVSALLTGTLVAVHGLVALIALPGLVWFGSGRVKRALAQLEAAAKGMYILNRDMDTISRLVERLRDEVEHVVGLVRLGAEKRGVAEEVAREIAKNDAGFNQKLDELEEHLYLCFMTINKARGIVTKEISLAT